MLWAGTTLKVGHDYDIFQSNAIDSLTSRDCSCAQECRLVKLNRDWAILPYTHMLLIWP